MSKLCILNKYKIGNDTVTCLTDMGFSEERAISALRIQNNVFSAALELLLREPQKKCSLPSPESSKTTAIYIKPKLVRIKFKTSNLHNFL